VTAPEIIVALLAAIPAAILVHVLTGPTKKLFAKISDLVAISFDRLRASQIATLERKVVNLKLDAINSNRIVMRGVVQSATSVICFTIGAISVQYSESVELSTQIAYLLTALHIEAPKFISSPSYLPASSLLSDPNAALFYLWQGLAIASIVTSFSILLQVRGSIEINIEKEIVRLEKRIAALSNAKTK
jgi:hypothetical protein